MLTPSEIHDLRQRVRMNQARPAGPFTRAVCVDGPLESLTLFVPEGAASIGWSTVTATGPVVAMYRQGDSAVRWRFAGWERPGGRA